MVYSQRLLIICIIYDFLSSSLNRLELKQDQSSGTQEAHRVELALEKPHADRSELCRSDMTHAGDDNVGSGMPPEAWTIPTADRDGVRADLARTDAKHAFTSDRQWHENTASSSLPPDHPKKDQSPFSMQALEDPSQQRFQKHFPQELQDSSQQTFQKHVEHELQDHSKQTFQKHFQQELQNPPQQAALHNVSDSAVRDHSQLAKRTRTHSHHANVSHQKTIREYHMENNQCSYLDANKVKTSEETSSNLVLLTPMDFINKNENPLELTPVDKSSGISKTGDVRLGEIPYSTTKTVKVNQIQVLSPAVELIQIRDKLDKFAKEKKRLR